MNSFFSLLPKVCTSSDDGMKQLRFSMIQLQCLFQSLFQHSRLIDRKKETVARTLFCTKSPAAAPVFNAVRNCAFNHFLSAPSLACMNFLMAIMLEPLRSLSSMIASAIPALYDMIRKYSAAEKWDAAIFEVMRKTFEGFGEMQLCCLLLVTTVTRFFKGLTKGHFDRRPKLRQSKMAWLWCFVPLDCLLRCVDLKEK